MAKTTTGHFEPGAKTRCISAPDAVWESAQRLANSNTGGNVSRMIQTLIRRAAMLPEEFDLEPGQGDLATTNSRPTVNAHYASLAQALSEPLPETIGN